MSTVVGGEVTVVLTDGEEVTISSVDSDVGVIGLTILVTTFD